MNTSTNNDLNMLVDEGWRTDKPADGEPVSLVYAAMHLLSAVLASLALGRWADARAALIRAMLLCGLAAWGAGCRVQSPAGRDFYGTALGRDLNGKLRPLDPPTSAETPAAKTDVEALLAWANEWLKERGAIAGPAMGSVFLWRIRDFAAALRAERDAREGFQKGRDYWHGLAGDLERENADLRAKLAAEDEAHANTRADLAAARRDSERLSNWHAAACKETRQAVAERDGLRSDLAAARRDIEAARRDRDATVDQVVAYRKENLDLRKVNLELVQRVEGLEKGIRGLAAHVPAKGDA